MMVQHKPKAIIVDIDGTLADCEHRRHFVDKLTSKQDWRSFYESMREDAVNDWCRQIVNKFPAILVSGRPEEYFHLTVDWLRKYTTPYLKLLMRKTGDYRDDTIVKQEIYDKHIKPFYDVLFVVDDRRKVVDMWRRNGLVCLHCAEGDF